MMKSGNCSNRIIFRPICRNLLSILEKNFDKAIANESICPHSFDVYEIIEEKLANINSPSEKNLVECVSCHNDLLIVCDRTYFMPLSLYPQDVKSFLERYFEINAVIFSDTNEYLEK